jgi:hypothetical protein
MNAPDTYVSGPFDYSTNPFGTILIFAGCRPDFCTCAKDPDTERDSR